MLQDTKKLLAAVIGIFDGSGDETSAWLWTGDHAIARSSTAIFSMWQVWKRHGRFPQSGGWLDQPLALIAQIEAIDMVYETMRFYTAEKADWSKMSATQLDIIKELDA